MTSPDPAPPAHGDGPHGHGHADHDLEEYAGGYIQAHHGSIPLWLLAVYFILFGWALYYAYVYWGSLGPGLAQ